MDEREARRIGRLVLAAGLWAAAVALAAGDPTADEFQGRWVHAAPHSAVIYWRMKDLALQAVSHVEYGPDASCGSRTEAAAEPRWAHFHRLKGLKPGATYHYRMVMVGDGGKTVRAGGTFTTPTGAGMAPVPGTLPGPPYVLGRPGRYLLTGDIAAPGTAIEIASAGVVLDLDGHTVTFDTQKGKQAAGIAISAQGSAAVLNGVVVQGDASADYSAAVESRWRPFAREIAGITARVHRPNGYPIKLFGRAVGCEVHHNLLVSRVTEIQSRHYPGNDLLRVDLGKAAGEEKPCRVHDNILTGGCHRGISVSGTSPAAQVYHNDIRHHALYVNGYAVNLHAPGMAVYGNRISSTGRGMHLTRPDLDVHDNWLDIRGHATLDDMPQGSRPFKKIMVELHGIKFEGAQVVRSKVYRNFVRIRQDLPDGDVRYVPATPLNVSCYDPAAMNEVYDNTIVALTAYRAERIGGYGNSGQWASTLYLLGLKNGPAPQGKHSIYIHDNRFIGNHLFILARGGPVTQTVRIERNRFTLADEPPPLAVPDRLRGLGELEKQVRQAGNTFP